MLLILFLYYYAALFDISQLTLQCFAETYHKAVELLLTEIEQNKFILNEEFQEIKESPTWKSIRSFVKDSKCLMMKEKVCIMLT